MSPGEKVAYIRSMTDTSTAPLAEIIAARLTDSLAPSRLEVINDSHHHARPLPCVPPALFMPQGFKIFQRRAAIAPRRYDE